MSTSFNKSMVDIQRRNAFDLSFINSLTGKVGTLVPVLCRKVAPGDVASIGANFNVELPPLAAPFRGKIDFCLEAFYVPNRIVYGGWQDYMLYNGGLANQFKPSGLTEVGLPYYRDTAKVQVTHNGDLFDYLGFPGYKVDGVQLTPSINVLPFLAYHKIYDDWYRDAMVQSPVFRPLDVSIAQVDEPKACALPYSRIKSSDSSLNLYNWADTKLFDGVDVFELRQRNYSKDYFTSAYTTVSGGITPVSVTTDSNDSFTISQFRTANSLQRFSERNMLARGDYKRTIKVNYGVEPSDAISNRAIYLGRVKTPITQNNIYANSNFDDTAGTSNPNPFTKSLGGRGACAYADSKGSLVDNYKITEHGYIIVIASLVPHTVYSRGINRELTELGKFSDAFLVPAFSQIGNQQIDVKEVFGTSTGSVVQVPFGYTERYAHYKTSFDQVHGLLTYGQNLDFMAIQRVTAPNPRMSSAFLQIPTNALDNITAVAADLSTYGWIADIAFEFKMLRALPKYSIPTLCDEILDSKWIEVTKSFNL